MSINNTFDSIYKAYYKKCFLFAKSYLHDETLASDCASDALIKLWDKRDTLDSIDNIQAFLFTIVKNLCLNLLQKEQLKRNVQEQLKGVEERELEFRIATLNACDPNYLFSKDIVRIYRETLATLPIQTCRVFKLSREDGLSNKEIANMLNLSVKGVDYHIAKALQLLRRTMKDYLFLFLLFRL